MQISIRVPLLAAVMAAGALAADPPYVGKWKLNPAKSDFGETTMTYEQLPGGEMKATFDGFSYTFKMDGKEYPTPWGGTQSWKALGTNAWEGTSRNNGKIVSVDTAKLSADGKTMTVDSKQNRPTGETVASSASFTRIAGTQGLAGKWKTKKVETNSPGVVEIAAKGADGMVVTYVHEKGVCDAKLDGKDYPATGPIWPAGWTCVLAKNGANALDATWKKDGKPMYKGTYTVSADGKTLTEIAGGAATTEKVKMVYDRQ